MGHVIRDELLLASLDFSTYENISVAIGKLVAQGMSEQTRQSLADAIGVYNYALNEGYIRPRHSPAERDKNMRDSFSKVQALELGDTAADKTSLAASRDIKTMMNAVGSNPLANSFLQIFVLAPTANALNDTMDEFIRLTTLSENLDFFSDDPMSFDAAAARLSADLADAHNLPASSRQPYDIQA